MRIAWFESRKFEAPARRIYNATVDIARRPALYGELGVPDSLDGRFDALVLHLSVVMRQLKKFGKTGRLLGRELASAFVDDMDRTLREMGVGDLSVGKRVKGMVRGFYGRLETYDRALDRIAESEELDAALIRNLYAGRQPPESVIRRTASYVRGLNQALEEMSLDRLMAPEFPKFLDTTARESLRPVEQCQN